MLYQWTTSQASSVPLSNIPPSQLHLSFFVAVINNLLYPQWCLWPYGCGTFTGVWAYQRQCRQRSMTSSVDRVMLLTRHIVWNSNSWWKNKKYSGKCSVIKKEFLKVPHAFVAFLWAELYWTHFTGTLRPRNGKHFRFNLKPGENQLSHNCLLRWPIFRIDIILLWLQLIKHNLCHSFWEFTVNYLCWLEL